MYNILYIEPVHDIFFYASIYIQPSWYTWRNYIMEIRAGGNDHDTPDRNYIK